MWLVTDIGFYSIVQKPWDIKEDTLTVRGRVKDDMNALYKLIPQQDQFTKITHNPMDDYAFRFRASRKAVAKAINKLVTNLKYENFKNQVTKTQGHDRSFLYHEVWDVLYQLQDGDRND